MADGKPLDEEQVGEKKYFQKVLDDVVSLNSLFTAAVFIGLNFAQPLKALIEHEPRCAPDPIIHNRLVAYEIASFSCFIFAGFLAKTVKVFLYTSENLDAIHRNLDAIHRKKKENWEKEKEKPHRKLKSLVGFFLSIYGTMIGCLLLLLAMVDVTQIKLGRLSCHSKFAVTTVYVMVGTIGLSLLIFFFTVTHGVIIALQAHDARKNTKKEKECLVGSAVDKV